MSKSNLKEYIDNTVKDLLKENKNSVKPSIIAENIHSMKENYRLLREYVEYANEGEYDGDVMLDNEISDIDSNEPEINKFIENIKSEALDAMAQLSKNGESGSETFNTLKKVFDVCHNTQKKEKEGKVE